MASVVRMMEAPDLDRVKEINGGEFPPNFLSVVYEREGKILGWACCMVKDDQPVAQASVAKEFSAFAVRRLVESFESFLVGIGLFYYVFGVHVKRKKWVTLIDRLSIYKRYSTKSMHHWYFRRLR